MVRVHESSLVGGEKCMVGSICGKDKFSDWSERVEERQRRYEDGSEDDELEWVTKKRSQWRNLKRNIDLGSGFQKSGDVY